MMIIILTPQPIITLMTRLIFPPSKVGRALDSTAFMVRPHMQLHSSERKPYYKLSE